MSNKTDDVEQDAAFALAEMHRLRTDLADERKRREEAESRRDHTAQWYAERLERLKQMAKERGFWSEMAAIIANGTATAHEPPTYAQQLNMAKHRAEQAERERDEYLCALGYDDETPRPPPAIVKHRINQLRRDLGAVVDERNDANDACERAEADNAALFGALRAIIEDARAKGYDVTPAGEALLAATHPGAALLERLRALEKVREACEPYYSGLRSAVGQPGKVLHPNGQRLYDACAAAALKGETCDECGMAGTHKVQCGRRG